MYPEPSEQPRSQQPGAMPSPALRERVLSQCRRAMEERHTARLRRKQRWQWSLAAGAAALLLLNAASEQQNAAQIAALVAGRARVVMAQPPPPAAIGSLRTRRMLLAALLRDPNAL